MNSRPSGPRLKKTSKNKLSTKQAPTKPLVLGLDWDDTLTAFPEALATLANQFSRCVIITLNDRVTVELAQQRLGMMNIAVEICPYDRSDFPDWKVEMCQKHKVAMMIDDDRDVVIACEEAGIQVIAVAVPDWR